MRDESYYKAEVLHERLNTVIQQICKEVVASGLEWPISSNDWALLNAEARLKKELSKEIPPEAFSVIQDKKEICLRLQTQNGIRWECHIFHDYYLQVMLFDENNCAFVHSERSSYWSLRCNYKNIGFIAANLIIFLYKNSDFCADAFEAARNMMKEEKTKELAKNTINTIIPQLMAGSDYEWCLKRDGKWGDIDRLLLLIKLDGRKMIEISLGFKSFERKLPELLNVIAKIKEATKELPFQINIKDYGHNSDIDWHKG